MSLGSRCFEPDLALLHCQLHISWFGNASVTKKCPSPKLWISFEGRWVVFSCPGMVTASLRQWPME